MIEPFIIGLLAGLGMGLEATGTYKNTKPARVIMKIPIRKNVVFHLHHWIISLLVILIIFLLIETHSVSKTDPFILLLLGYFIAFGVQGVFLQDAWKFVEIRERL
jgi:hypothetical protein